MKSNTNSVLRLAGILSAMALAGPVEAQVGFPPDASPYRYITPNKFLGFSAGYVWGDLGAAGVGPSNGLILVGRFDIRLSGAIGVVVNAGAMTLERRVIDPTKSPPDRDLGIFPQNVAMADVGLELLLSGRKTWHGMAPYLGASIGLAVGEGVSAEPAGFSFSTKFLLVPSAGTRFHVSDRFTLNLEVRDMMWRLGYPSPYFFPTDDGGDPVLDSRVQGSKQWTHHFVLTLGFGYGLGR